MLKINLWSLSILFILIGVLLFGYSEDDKKTAWKSSETFTKDNMTLYGTKGKFGIIKVNGKADEPEFPVGEGRLYAVYFLDGSKEINGKKIQNDRNSQRHKRNCSALRMGHSTFQKRSKILCRQRRTMEG
ncbi:hypothetical protein [Bacillus solimangrovi]|uniref:Uncharacterized protein n=1 Tax=Bacillus solimangrovi TaxID=1305675 RepID=A0A1E5LAJ3_9BACI|nr:hypothetical protein [Bacillus solimangrovi]OEH91105.1 hypothetical protein BFG57_06965 [Bacillus solimangrovi]